jgi:hypothetical protein
MIASRHWAVSAGRSMTIPWLRTAILVLGPMSASCNTPAQEQDSATAGHDAGKERHDPPVATGAPATIASASPSTVVCVAGTGVCLDERWLKACPWEGGPARSIDCAAIGLGFCRDGRCAECIDGLARATTVCKDNVVHGCSSSGSLGAAITTCAEDEACVEASNATAECEKRICTPGQKTCVGTSIAECNPSGTAYRNMVPCIGQLCEDAKCVPIRPAQG